MMLLKQLVIIDYKAEYADKDKEERPKVLFVVDLGMLLTPMLTQKGDMKGDMGRVLRH